MNILAADDEEGALKLLVRAIRGAKPDAEVTACRSASEALRQAEGTPFDAAFLDIRMPEINGLELGKKLKQLQPSINIIFTTGFDDYAVDAFRMHSSGYLLKPVTKNDVATELDNLRCPVRAEEEQHVFAKTFGMFDLFADGRPVQFRREKAKELLAYLIDLGGSSATRKQIASVIFGDDEYSRSSQGYLSQIISSLRTTLTDAGLPGLLICDRNCYSVDTKLFSCDAYDYLKGDPQALNAFRGEYMTQYEWAEDCIGRFYE